MAECAIFQAPLCYDGVCRVASNATLDVFVKRLVAPQRRSDRSTPSVIIVGGGGADVSLNCTCVSAH
jgi:hypothetical protein